MTIAQFQAEMKKHAEASEYTITFYRGTKEGKSTGLTVRGQAPPTIGGGYNYDACKFVNSDGEVKERVPPASIQLPSMGAAT